MTTIVSRTLSVHKEHEFLLKLEAAGFNDDLVQRVIDSKGNELAKKIVGYVSRNGYESTTPQKLAREIMGKNIFGVEEAIQHFGVKPTKSQLETLSEVPFTEEQLRECKDTHILVAVFPLSILEIRNKMARNIFYNQNWYDNESFAKAKGEVSWQLILKTPVNDSINTTWETQQNLLHKNEEIPTAQVMVYAIIGHFLSTGERLFPRIYVRTSSVDSDGDRVYVGYFDSDGLYVNDSWDGGCYSDLGVASARKPACR